jgi:hypothetical protein
MSHQVVANVSHFRPLLYDEHHSTDKYYCREHAKSAIGNSISEQKLQQGVAASTLFSGMALQFQQWWPLAGARLGEQ